MRLIDADALKKVFHAEWDGVLVWDEGGETTADEFCNLVDDAPTIEAEPVKTGKWGRMEYSMPKYRGTAIAYQCSCCQKLSFSEYQYCPFCGAKTENEE